MEAAPPPVDLAELAAAQSDCEDCRQAPFSKALRAVQVDLGTVSLWVDTFSGVLRPVVPKEFRRRVVAAIHS
jgi:hypothetical protein